MSGESYLPATKGNKREKGRLTLGWSRSAMQSVSRFYICLNALPNLISLPGNEKGKHPDGT
jgi:hypothetical protein